MVTKTLLYIYTVLSSLALIAVSVILLQVHRDNYVIPKDKWICAIEHIKSGDCVGYSINENEIKKYINSGHREHNLPERQPLLNTK